MGLPLVRDILPLYVLVFRGVESTCPLEVVLVFVVRGVDGGGGWEVVGVGRGGLC